MEPSGEELPRRALPGAGAPDASFDLDFTGRVLAMLLEPGSVEAKLARILNAVRADLGRGPVDRPHARPGTEGNFTVGAFFLFTPDRAGLDIYLPQNFPPEQATLRIPADHGHPGLVATTGEPLLLADTARDARFVQILKTARMGSAMFSPLRSPDRVLGVMVNAAIQGGTYTHADFRLHRMMADLAALVLHLSGRRA